MAGKIHTCKKCGRAMDESNFYTSKNLEKYPNDGKMDQCKKCITMHINNWEPSTYLWILKEVDVPYVEEEWNVLLERYCKDPKKVTGMTVLGRYLSKMKLKQWKDYSWESSQEIREDIDKRKGIQKSQEEYAADGIYKAIMDGTISEEEAAAMGDYDELESEFGVSLPSSSENPFCEVEIELGNDLTEEDRRYLTLKWGKTYRPDEWVRLEQLYIDVTNSFDIQSATHIDYLKFICKTSLKMNQALDLGDIEGFQKLAKTYDSLMKSAKFTAAQNKAESGEFVDSVGELVSICEEQGFIPRFHTDEPKDIVDLTLQDFKRYTNRLVTEEMGLGNMIEDALRQMQRQEEQEEGELDEEEDFAFVNENDILKDADYVEFYDEIEEQKEEDQKVGEE